MFTTIKNVERNFVTRKDNESWLKLLEAASLCQFEKLLQYKDHSGVSDVYYHKECRKKFCHKKRLTKVNKEQSGSRLNDTYA